MSVGERALSESLSVKSFVNIIVCDVLSKSTSCIVSLAVLVSSSSRISGMTLSQWCTTFFGQGPLIDFLNPPGAKQV